MCAWSSKCPLAVIGEARNRHKFFTWALLVLLLGTLAMLPAPAALLDAPSQYARVAFENEHIRVVELLASSGAAREMHTQAPAVLVSASKARFEMTSADGAASIVDFNEGQISWQGVGERRSWRLIAGEAHVFFIEPKSAMSGLAPPPRPIEPTHSTVIDPDKHHLVFDNEHVRVIDGFGSAGAESAPHTHPPSILVSLNKARFRVTIDGRTRIFDFEPSMVRWSNHFEHSWQILAGDGRVIMVEVKSAYDDPSFRRR